MYKLDSMIAKLEAQLPEQSDRLQFLSYLKARLAEKQQATANSPLILESGLSPSSELHPEIVKIIRITSEKSGDSDDSGDSALQPQILPPESQVTPVSPESLPSDTGDPLDVSDNAKNFAAALDKLDPALREVAADLYEHLHYKSKSARLTSPQREAIVELLRHRTCEQVARIIAEPPPIGMSLRTSTAGVVRFREDYLRCAMHEAKLKSAADTEAKSAAIAEAFQKANSSDDTFRQDTVHHLRKRLFQAAHNPQADYHEIRWLIKSLEMIHNT